jgi:eukaryotic-like serine/threonine-protein kinase
VYVGSLMATATGHVGRVLGGRYVLRELVGAGGSAQVFLADDTTLQRPVAVKLLHHWLADDGAFLRRFRAEATAAAALNHPNVVAVYDWGEEDVPGTLGSVQPYIVTEYLPSGSLRSMLDRGRTLTVSQALLVALDAAKGLDYAHRQGLVHRDIKPANILFGADGRLRIADFGLARALAEASATEPEGLVLGTARYASPEQAKGQPLDGRSDVYSLVLVVVEALTGRVPFAADTTVATLMGRVDRLLPVSADMGPLAPILERGGRPDPDDRYDARSFAMALVQAAKGLPRPRALPLVATLPDAVEAHPDDTIVLAEEAPATVPPVAVAVAVDSPAPDAVSLNDGPTLFEGAPPSATDPTTPLLRPVTTDLASSGHHLAVVPSVAAPPARSNRGLIAALVAGVVVIAALAGALWWRTASREQHVVPDLTTGLTVDQARNAVSELGFEIREQTVPDTVVPNGVVVRTVPTAGQTLREGDVLQLIVSSGPPLSPVPNVVGRALSDATALIEAAGLTVGSITPTFDETVSGDTVLSQEPAEVSLTAGQPVNLVVSGGPAPRAVPDVAGLTLDEATAGITGARLVPAPREEFSNDVEAGRIVGSDPPPGTEVAVNTTITIVVSRGPDLVVIPNIAGMTSDAAAAALANAGLVGELANTTLGGTVIATDPLIGTQVLRGSTVIVTLGAPPPG